MENHRGVDKQVSGQTNSEMGIAAVLVRAALLQILGFVKYSQTVPFLWLLLGSLFFITFSFAPESTGMVLLLVLRLLLIEQPNSALEGNIDPEIVVMAFGRLFLLFTVLLYLIGLVLNQFGIHLLRGFRRKVMALVALCLALFFILNICYSMAVTPFNGPRSQWLVVFVVQTIALFVSGFWAICVQEAANSMEQAFLTPTSIQRRQP